MAGAVRKSKLDEIAEKIESMASDLKAGVAFNIFAWKQLHRDIEQFEKIPGYYGASLLNQAVMWSFRGDLIEMKRLFNRYAGEIGKDWDWYLIVANMAPKLGDVEGVVGMLSYEYPHNDKFKLAQVAEICGQAGFFIAAKKAFARLAELDSEMAARVMSRTNQYIVAAAEYMLDHGLSEKDVAERLVFASRAVVELGHRLSSYSVTANEFGITVEFAVRASFEEIIELDFSITERLVSKFEDVMSEHVSIGVLPVEVA